MPADSLRVGVLEVGSRAVRLLVADVAEGALTPVLTRARETRLMSTVGQTSEGRESVFQDTAGTVRQFAALAASQGATITVSFGTEAVRRLVAAGDIPPHSPLGRLRVLTAEDEALLSARAAMIGLPASSGAGDLTLVVDQGGGSVDVAVVSSNPRIEIRSSGSLDLGSDQLARRFAGLGHDLAAFRMALEAEIRAPVGPCEIARTIVQGSVATKCAWLSLPRSPGSRYDPRMVQGVKLSVANLEAMLSVFARRPYAQWEVLRPMFDPANPQGDEMERVVTGTVALSRLLRCLAVVDFSVSAYGTRHGMALEVAETSV